MTVLVKQHPRSRPYSKKKARKSDEIAFGLMLKELERGIAEAFDELEKSLPDVSREQLSRIRETF